MSVELIESKSFHSNVLESMKPTVVLFGNNQCPLCNELKPTYTKLAEKHKDKYSFFRVNTVMDSELSDVYLDGGVPTICIFVEGQNHTIPWRDEVGYSENFLDACLGAFFNILEEKNDKERI